MDKEHVIITGISHIIEILHLINPEKAFQWSILYKKMDENLLANFDDFDKKYHGLFAGEEYVLIYDGDHLLYAINVTGDSALYTLRELFDKLSEKF